MLGRTSSRARSPRIRNTKSKRTSTTISDIATDEHKTLQKTLTPPFTIFFISTSPCLLAKFTLLTHHPLNPLVSLPTTFVRFSFQIHTDPFYIRLAMKLAGQNNYSSDILLNKDRLIVHYKLLDRQQER
jgi:hypothetical protein